MSSDGPDVRVNPLTQDEVFVTGGRQKRPNLPNTACPFCPGGLEAPDPYDIRWFVNRWPALPDGKAEVLLYTSQHDGTLWGFGTERIEKVIALWEERTAELGARDDVSYVLIFENHGPQVGATIAHPHGQLYAFDQVPPRVLPELERDDCGLCDHDPGQQLVSESGDWQAWVPHAAIWPYELTIAPKAHLADLVQAAGSRSDLAVVLEDTLARLDHLFDAPMPYMLWIHQKPSDGGAWPAAHVHFHISPILRSPGTERFVAAGEQGSGLYFNPVLPEKAAEDLRAAKGAHDD